MSSVRYTEFSEKSLRDLKIYQFQLYFYYLIFIIIIQNENPNTGSVFSFNHEQNLTLCC